MNETAAPQDTPIELPAGKPRCVELSPALVDEMARILAEMPARVSMRVLMQLEQEIAPQRKALQAAHGG